ncbi:MAG: hypothetical protein K0S41_1253 [Anaerocolumna sp.]|jgi:hypothetical protein|nr:hypothetical protein [Anaerocolumna sp.]
MNMRIHNKKELVNCLLHSLSSCDNISLSDVAELQEFMKKESKLKEVLDFTKIKHRPDGRLQTLYL